MRASSSGFAGGHLSASVVDSVSCKNIPKHVQGHVYVVFYMQPFTLCSVRIANGQMQLCLIATAVHFLVGGQCESSYDSYRII